MLADIIIVDDNLDKQTNFLKYLKERGLRVVRTFKTGEHAREFLMNHGVYDVAIIDRTLGSEESLSAVTGEDLMELSKRINPARLVISFSAYDDKPKFADMVLQKPVFDKAVDELMDYIRRVRG